MATSPRNWKYLGQLSDTYHLWQSKRKPSRLTTSIYGDDNDTPHFDNDIYDVGAGTIAAAIKGKHSEFRIVGDSVEIGCQYFSRKKIRSLMRKAGLSLSMRSTK